MKPNEFINQFLHQLNNIITPGAEALGSEMQQKLRAAAQAAFDRLDLVTRDEFDAQQAVLKRSREKLEKLEQQLAELKVQVDNQHS
ncbi:accessory factor UbiK family protein [Porticoccus sp.]|uniref:accessory factor UbiK family protein n=1 Tax=Porticoccus sp. TaxID=2024853 RepID=UPI003F69E028